MASPLHKTTEFVFTMATEGTIKTDLPSALDEMEGRYPDPSPYSTMDMCKYKPFKECKEGYVLFMLELMRCYGEVKRFAQELEPVYATLFRADAETQTHGGLMGQSRALHSGLFFEKVLRDPILGVSWRPQR